ncbi:MAG: metallophosphoesterase family protein [Bacteroidales bacterium]|nr:metallophosphoesterase family protein [Bacteroidales bacterium]
MYIGVISDTHCSFDDDLREFLAPVDVIWHAGDFGDLATYAAVHEFKPTIAVYGNCDGQDVRLRSKPFRIWECEGMKVMMMHIGGYPGRWPEQVLRLIEAHRPDIFVCGHSHILKVIRDQHYDMLTINPGACGHQGFHVVRTAVRFHIDEGKPHDMEVGEWDRF